MSDMLNSDFVPNNISVVAFYNLCTKYASDMHVLYNDLKELIYKKFGSGKIIFKPNERIIFLHDDLDFFLSKSTPGFTLYNLQLILKELNIPNYFCVVISNIPNYEKHTATVQNMLTNDDFDICPVSSLYFCICDPWSTASVDTDFKKIERSFIVLSRQNRAHRTYFMSKIFDIGLQDFGFISYNNISYNNISREEDSANDMSCDSTLVDFNLLTCSPSNRYNTNYVLLKNVNNHQSFLKFDSSIKKYKNFEENIDVADKSTAMMYENSPIQRGFLYIALETTIVYPEVFLSKISFKGIVKKRPFVILGVPGTIKYLQQLGFKTFDRFWDESYDQIDDFELRVDAIIDIINSINKLSIIELKELAENMKDILEYNFDHFSTAFLESEKQKLINSIR